MVCKEMIAMLLAGGQGSRLGVLTSAVAKPAVAFGGKYNVFPLEKFFHFNLLFAAEQVMCCPAGRDSTEKGNSPRRCQDTCMDYYSG